MKIKTKILMLIILVIGILCISSKVFAAEAMVSMPDANLRKIVDYENKDNDKVRKSAIEEITFLEPLNVSNLTGLEYAVNLESIDFYYDKVTDFTPLKNLTKLEHLGFGEDNVKERDFSFLSNMPDIKYLVIGGYLIKENTLPKLENLITLTLWNNALTNINILGLSNFPNLEYLSISDNNMPKPVVKDLTSLKSLELYNCGVTDLSGVDNLPKLEQLNLSYNKIRELSSVVNLINKYSGGLIGLNLKYNMLDLANPEVIAKLDSIKDKIAYFSTSSYTPQKVTMFEEDMIYMPGEGATKIVKGLDVKNNVNTVSELTNSKNLVSADSTVEVYNAKGEKLSGGSLVGTGCVIKITNSKDEVEEYTVVIYGDVTGDGKINAIDALSILKHANKIGAGLNGLYKYAGKLNKTDGEPTAIDALNILKHANNIKDIEQ